MEDGNRTPNEDTYTAVAVAQTTDPGRAFQLIDVVLNFNIAPTTSELITITTVRTKDSAVTVVEATYDPSIDGDTGVVIRFDKRFADACTIGVAYTNTDARTITVVTTYQLDASVV